MSRTHRFFLEPIEPPDNWKGTEDPRAPRLVFRGLTVGESQKNLDLGSTIDDMAQAVTPCILRCEGVWGLYLGDSGDTSPNTWPARGEVLRHVLQEDLLAFIAAVSQATSPRIKEDLAPLDSGREP